jgi:hypothetical protein
MMDFSSLCINMDTIITAICSNDRPQPIFHQILLNFIAIVNNPDWVHWSDNVGSMPLLHWYCYSFLEWIFNCFADFATNFGNGNIMTKACPITKLNTSTLKSALTVLKTFRSQINLHQAAMTATMVMPGSVSAYNVNPWNNIQASGVRKEDKNSLMDCASCPTPNASFTPEQHNGGKRDLTTPNASFTCKGKECTNTNCKFAHPRKALELKRKTIILIANHFIKKDVGWFNEYHFMRMPNITDGVKKLLVNTKCPTSKSNMTSPLDHKTFA